VSVTVGFSQASTSLIAPASGATPPADASAEGGEAGIFAALLAMLAPDLEAATDAEAAASALPGTPAPQAPLAAMPNLGEPTTSKALLEAFTGALKAARTAIDEGKPLDPALEGKLREATDAVAAWFAGQPQLQAPPVDTTRLAEAAAGSAILPVSPDTQLESAPKVVQAQVGPSGLAQFGEVLKDFAAHLEKLSPDLASALTRLADRVGTGDIADDVMAQLGLSRVADSTSPELDQLVAALAGAPAKPAAKSANTASIAAPVLDIPDVLADETQPGQKPGTMRADAPAEPARPAASLDTEVTLEAKPSAEEKPAADARPSAAKAEMPAPAPTHAATTPDTTVAAAQAATPATAARAIHAAYAAPVHQINLPQVAFEVVRHFEAGNTRFQIRLDPPELGRIDVKLDLDRSGTINARMVVERPETLDMMMRDQRALQQALQQAGLDASRTNLEFSLRQNPFAGSDFAQGDGNGGQSGFGPFGAPGPDESTELAAQTHYRGSASASGVNLFV